jgi:NAD-dependent deacetylase
MTATKEQLDALWDMIRDSRKIVFFTGAGVSTDSGIPDFRSQDGLYHLKYKYPPEEIISHSFFLRDPEEFYRFYRAKLIPGEEIRPNAAHLRLAELEQEGKLRAVITQNIDGLHQMAGSKRVIELHGSVHRCYCAQCRKPYPEEYVNKGEGIPRCSCGGRIKPDVVLYEEGLDQEVLSGAIHAIRQADLMIVAGTSLTVYPAAGLLQYFRGSRLVLINRDPTPYDGSADLVLHEKVGEVLGALRVAPPEEPA